MTLPGIGLREACVVGVCAVACGAHGAAPRYQYFDLGPARQAYRVGVDDSGRVSWSDRYHGAKHVRLWEGGHTTSMPHPTGIGASSFLGISNAGVIGLWAGSQLWEPFLWTDGQSISLERSGDSQTTPFPSSVEQINNRGQVAGSTFRLIEEVHPVRQAAIWNGAGEALLLENDRPDLDSEALAINDRGHVLGTRHTEPLKQVISIWDNTGLMVESISTPTSWFDVEPRGINAGDTVIANLRLSESSPFTVGAAWEDGAWSILPRIGGHSVVEAINDAGVIVGHTNYLRATMWSDGVRYDLNTLVEGAGGASLLRAYDVNESGWIVGTALDPGQSISERVFLAVPIIPAPAPVMLAGAGGLLAARRRRC